MEARLAFSGEDTGLLGEFPPPLRPQTPIPKKGEHINSLREPLNQRTVCHPFAPLGLLCPSVACLVLRSKYQTSSPITLGKTTHAENSLNPTQGTTPVQQGPNHSHI